MTRNIYSIGYERTGRTPLSGAGSTELRNNLWYKGLVTNRSLPAKRGRLYGAAKQSNICGSGDKLVAPSEL